MDPHPHSSPLFLSPALPSDLLQFIINHCTYPTTLIICAGRAEFLSALTQDLLWQQEQQQQQQPHTADEPHGTDAWQAPTATTEDLSNTSPTAHEPLPHAIPPPLADHHHSSPPRPHPIPNNRGQATTSRLHPLLTPHLAQLSTTRHIRTVFIPTVSHLRAFLSVFSSPSTNVPPPTHPPQPGSSNSNSSTHTTRPRKRPPPPPLLVVYDFLTLHRNTSEWSVQGLGASSAVLVEAGRREGLGVFVVEGIIRQAGVAAADRRGGDDSGTRKGVVTMREVLGERVPVLSGGGRRVGGGGAEGTGWAGKTVDVGRVLGRWFRFREGEWDGGR